ncbi:uncharacterized protein ACRADG_010440 isoform 2-T3 [Cochliomyia hominivorax]
MMDIKKSQDDTTLILKSLLKKPKINKRKKVIKPRQTKKSLKKSKAVKDQDTKTDEEQTYTKQEETSIFSNRTTSSTSEILRPCINTLQNKKCLSEMACEYMHSDFPCKYYYLNLHCPQDVKCQYMHNGPLETNLMEALRSHILDLLSTKPSTVEIHFIQQLHNIEDLSQRLQSFQKIKNQQEISEVIEVMDDDPDEDIDQVLIIDESSDDVNGSSNNINTETTISNLAKYSQNTDVSEATNSKDKFDIVYQKFKETNTIIDEIDQKLQSLKNTSNMSANEKIQELQNIYELLKEQEKRLPIYENLNTVTTEQISKIYNNVTELNLQNEHPHVVLVNPEILNEIQTSVNGSQNLTQESIVNLIEDEMAVPQENDIEFLSNEILEKENRVEYSNNENHSNDTNTISDNVLPDNITNKDIDVISDNDNNTNKDNEELSPNNIMDKDIEVESLINLENANNNFEMQEINENINNINEQINCDMNSEIIENITQESLPNESEQHEKEFEIQEIPGDNNNIHTDEINENEIFAKNIELNNNNTTLFNETLELSIASNEKEVIEENITQHQNNEEIYEEESPPYEEITAATTKPLKKSRLCLRSHNSQNSGECGNNDENSPSIKPIKTRRLRLPKPNPKSTEKANQNEYQINADIINKLIKTNANTPKEATLVRDVEVPLTQNVILTKRFLKRAKAKLQQSFQNETSPETSSDNVGENVEQNMLALHGDNNENLNKIENIAVNQLSQLSDKNNSLNLSQDPLIVGETNETKEQTYTKSDINSNTDKSHTKRRISFENPTTASPSASNIKEHFNLGNPHVVLTKIKLPYLLTTTQKDTKTDSTITNTNSIVTSSSPTTVIADDKIAQKRRSLTPEYDLDSSLEEKKYLKMKTPKMMCKVNFDNRKRTYSGQSNTSKEGDFDTDSSDEKLTITDALQTTTSSSLFSTSTSSSISPTNNECKQVFEPSLTHVATIYEKHQHDVTAHHHQHHHQHVHKEQRENESDLRQQIENVSNKSDLQLQIQHQQHELQQQYEQKESTISITKNNNINSSNNLPHKQYQEKEQNKLVVDQPTAEYDKKPSQPQQYENIEKNILKEEKQISNTCSNPYVINNNNTNDRQIQSSTAIQQHIDDCERSTSNSSDKYTIETFLVEKQENIEYSTYSSLYNKLSSHSTKRQINFENSSVNITPISSPTYGDDTIASPSPVRKSYDFRMGGEIDGRLTYPPIPYILHEIDLGRIEINKPHSIDKLKKTIQLDPRIFRSHIKKQLMTLCKPVAKAYNTLLPSATYNTSNLSTTRSGSSSSFAMPPTSTMISPYDPRNHRTSAAMVDIVTPSMAQQSVLTPYNHINATTATTSPTTASYIHSEIPNSVPLALQYHNTSPQTIMPQQQQIPNMFLYGCLQRSPWYQSLMSTMKIQINQSISQLVRALNIFHRERLLNPELVFDVFKIDCAGELLEIMRNLGIFVDANGIINEQRHVPSFGGRSCCKTMPVNATYSFIQQVLTPNTHCSSLTAATMDYNAAGGISGATIVGPLNVNEPFVSCYIKAPEPQLQQKHHQTNDCGTTYQTQQDDNNNNNNNCNRNFNNNNNNNNSNNNNNGNCCSNNHSCCNQNNNNNSNRRFGGNQFKKPYDNNNYNNNNFNNNYRSNNQRSSSYNNNPRFSKPGLSSPNKSISSPPNSPRGGFGGGFSYGAGGGRGGNPGRYNNNRRFNSFNNNNDKYNNNGEASGGGSSSWFSANTDSNDNRYNKKFGNINSPIRTSPTNNSISPGAAAGSADKPFIASSKNDSDEECWDSDN